jgi:hypothetical protein
VRWADATLIFSARLLKGGSLLTWQFCRTLNKDWCLVWHTPGHFDQEDVARVREWLRNANPAVLNLAGSRESHEPGIQAWTRRFLVEVLAEVLSREPTFDTRSKD